jgi:hypothetical protein
MHQSQFHTVSCAECNCRSKDREQKLFASVREIGENCQPVGSVVRTLRCAKCSPCSTNSKKDRAGIGLCRRKRWTLWGAICTFHPVPDCKSLHSQALPFGFRRDQPPQGVCEVTSSTGLRLRPNWDGTSASGPAGRLSPSSRPLVSIGVSCPFAPTLVALRTCKSAWSARRHRPEASKERKLAKRATALYEKGATTQPRRDRLTWERRPASEAFGTGSAESWLDKPLAWHSPLVAGL